MLDKNTIPLVIIVALAIGVIAYFALTRNYSQSGQQQKMPAPPTGFPAGPVVPQSTRSMQEPLGSMASPIAENSFTIRTSIRFEDGNPPEVYTGRNALPEMYEWKDMKVLVNIKGRISTFKGVVKKEGNSYCYGETVVVQGKVSDYTSVDKIIFRVQGYRDVVFENILITNGYVACPEVVMRK